MKKTRAILIIAVWLCEELTAPANKRRKRRRNRRK